MPRRESPVSTRKLQCFFACAFGKADVDNVFTLLHSILLPDGVVVNRVDKTVHNMCVDVKIIEMIKSSDFCICDLTYARPSAYFEAGFAEGRGTPVIYICRDDHRHPSLEPHKIHFDVQMRNIVWWNESSPRIFQKELKNRVSHVAKPIRERLKKQQAGTEERTTFSNTSLIDRLAKLVDDGRLALQKSSIWKSPRRTRVVQHPAASDHATRIFNNHGPSSRMRLFSIYRGGDVATHVSLIASDSVQKDLFVHSTQQSWGKYDLFRKKPGASLNNLIVIHTCLRRLSSESVHRHNVLVNGLSEGIYAFSERHEAEELSWRSYVIVVDSVASFAEAKQRILNRLEWLQGHLDDITPQGVTSR